MRNFRQIQKKFLEEKALSRLAAPGPFEIVIILDHLKPTFNIAKIFRSAEAFGVREIHLIGIPFFNPYPAKGALRRVPAKFFDGFRQSYESLVNEGYSFYVLEPKNSVSLTQTSLAKKCAFIIGHEAIGVSISDKEFAHLHKIVIPQKGKVDSLNASVAASVAMYEYIRQHGT